MKAKTWIEISQSALRHNAQVFLDVAGHSKVMAVVKANAYGHGLVESATVLEDSGVHWLGVDHIDEALKLRNSGIKLPILVLGYTRLNRLQEASERNISLVVYNAETIEALGTLKRRTNVHLVIETGLTRDGIDPGALPELLTKIKQYPQIQMEGVYLHFANIEDTKSRMYADHQIKQLKKATDIINEYNIYPEYIHAASSAASLLYADTRMNMMRVGVAMYGLWPSAETKEQVNNKILKPALTWKTIVAQVKKVKKDTPISYGLTELMPHDGTIAVLPIGYADGFDRASMSSHGNILIQGVRCKVMGRVCMNMTMVDVTHVNDVMPETEAVIIGEQNNDSISAEELADLAGTINYEIVARLNPEIPRIVVE